MYMLYSKKHSWGEKRGDWFYTCHPDKQGRAISNRQRLIVDSLAILLECEVLSQEEYANIVYAPLDIEEYLQEWGSHTMVRRFVRELWGQGK